MDDDKFSLDNFKKWMRHDKSIAPKMKMERTEETFIGLEVEPKISIKRLSSVIEIDNGLTEEVIADFKKNGGRITSVEGKNFMIECDSGSFVIARHYVTRR